MDPTIAVVETLWDPLWLLYRGIFSPALERSGRRKKAQKTVKSVVVVEELFSNSYGSTLTKGRRILDVPVSFSVEKCS